MKQIAWNASHEAHRMKHIVFHFDFVSPYAMLAFERLPQALEGISHRVEYRPVLFGAMLKTAGNLGPAEIPGKREWTYRQVQWLAHKSGVAFDMPARHPFNPIGLLRLALACSDARDGGAVNRHVCEQIFRHVWNGGGDAADGARLAVLTERLTPRRDPAGDAVKAELRVNTEAATAAGVFGVPSMTVDGRVFWGVDALPMLADYLRGEAWFDGPAWDAAAKISGDTRRQP